MGIRASLRQISAPQFEALRATGEMDRDALRDAAVTHLDKAWLPIHNLFKDAEPPLKYVLDGDYHHPLSPANIDAFLNSQTSDFFIGCVSPMLVKSISERLGGLTDFELDRLAERAGVALNAYDRQDIDTLRQAYLEAARDGDALSILII